MNGAPPGLPDTSDIGLSRLSLRAQAPQWLIYEGERKGRQVVAWRFWPPVYQSVTILQEAALHAGLLSGLDKALNPAPPSGLWPDETLYSDSSSSFWLIYPNALPASSASLANRQRLLLLMNEVMHTLAHLHKHGLFHLDVHPSNIVDHDGKLLLAGIGIDLRMRTGIAAGNNAGLARPKFGAPEQWDASGHSQIGPWTDIFGAAATFYHCLVGHPPADFRQRLANPGWREYISAKLHPVLQSYGIDGRKIEAMILFGLEPDPAKRPQSIAEWSRTTPPIEEKISSAAIKPGRAVIADKVPDAIIHPALFWTMLGALLLLCVWLGYKPISEAFSSPAQEFAVEESEADNAAADEQELGVLPPAPLSPEAAADAAVDAAAADAAYAADEAYAALQDAAAATSPEVPLIDLTPEAKPTPARTAAPLIDLRPDPQAAQPRQTASPSQRSQTVYLPADNSSRAAAGPSLRSGSLNAAEDFPIPAGGRAARAGTSVVVEFDVGVDGIARNCRITQPGPDAATNNLVCSLVVARLRFNPALTANGTPVEARYSWRQSFSRR